MTFEEWWVAQPARLDAAVVKNDARAIWDAATKAEREACAKVCDEFADKLHYGECCDEVTMCAEEIRMRPNK